MHPGANHYYIHAVEASPDPGTRPAGRPRLADLVPGGGHLVHMPSHIYLRVGSYAEASVSNERAILADEAYLSQCQVHGMYPVGYYPHNMHFLWFASTFEGRSAQAIDMARKTAEKVPHHVSAHAGSLHDLPIVPLYAYVRFGKWTDILTTPQPAPSNDYAQAIWHYARRWRSWRAIRSTARRLKRRRSTNREARRVQDDAEGFAAGGQSGDRPARRARRDCRGNW